jgi:Cu(I)/Ag(I) efflux system membrane protein CusA/SilA
MRAKQRLKIILPIVFFVIHATLSRLQIRDGSCGAHLPDAATLKLKLSIRCSRSPVWVGYIALFSIAVETGVVMVFYLDEAFQHRLAQDEPMTEASLLQAVIDCAVQRLRPKLMTVTAVILSLAPILWKTGIGSEVMKPNARPIVGGMITSTIHVLILVPVFVLLIKRKALRSGRLRALREAVKMQFSA